MALAQVAGAPHFVVDEEDNVCCDNGEGDMPVAPAGLVRPVAMKVQVSRPLPMKVARPIPQRATEQFYDEAYRQGIPAYAVNAAIMESHDWHRKWTQQDEEGHTMPTTVVSEQPVPQAYAYQAPEQIEAMINVVDRQAGARNPSPEWGTPSASPSEQDAQAERKRGRWDAEEEQQQQLIRPQATTAMPPLLQILWDNDQETASTLRHGSANSEEDADDEQDDDDCYLLAPAAKRPVPVRPSAPAVGEDDDEDYNHEPPLNMNPILRPVALRVPRPVVAKFPSSPASLEDRGIPQIIHADENSCSKMSAVTLGSGLSALGDFQTEGPMVRSINVVEDECDSLGHVNMSLADTLSARREALLQALAISGGDAQNEAFVKTIDPLSEVFEQQDVDTRVMTGIATTQSVHGTWLTLTKPTFFGNLGENDSGDPMYTLGRMTFDMFSPTNLVCSLQGNFNSIEIVGDEERGSMLAAGLVPKGLREEVENRDVVLRTYK
jgi:hypothetical protein